MTVRVLLADDQVLVRSGFRMIIDAAPDLSVIAEADNGLQALQLAQDLRPDVCLLDIRMPGLDGLEVTRQLNARGPSTAPAIVIVTTFDLDEYVDAALRNGACGFLLKDSGPELLVHAVRAAASGEALISPRVTTRLLQHYLGQRPRTKPTASQLLSEREQEVARHVAHGLTNQEVAGATHTSVSTVKTHLANIQRKVGARNRVEVTRWVFEHLGASWSLTQKD